ncbi:hypothetical protein DFJ74DRAFT_755739 [Hyaloraphidium curvatum]|nr:hypothetical protein DFJ74DRAFT_755739 [Hyaloraphidium curvatum]
MRSLPLLALFSLLALGTSAAPLRRQTGPPAAAGSTGLRATACSDSALSLSCDGGSVIAIADAFYGRDIPGEAALDFSCQTPANNTQADDCSLSPALSAALAVDVGRSCDGQQSCSYLLDGHNADMWGDPCPGIHKFLRVSYDCMAPALFNPVPPAPEPSAYPTLGIRRPSTFAADKCPLVASAVANLSATVANWAIKVAPNPGPFNAFTIDMVDLDMSALAYLIELWTGNQGSIATTYYLHIRALNVFFPGTTVSIGRTNEVNMTTVIIEAANIIAMPGSNLDVYSYYPNPATGAKGPDVRIKAGRVFGRLDVRFNSMAAGSPLTSTVTGTYDLGLSPALAPPSAAGCSMWQQAGEYDLAYMPLPRCGQLPAPDQGFNPICASNFPSSPGPVQLTISAYFGPGWATAPAQDMIGLPMNTDRFTWPGKSDPYGTLKLDARVFYNAEGRPGNASTTTTAYSGVASSADYTIPLSSQPRVNGSIAALYKWSASFDPSNPLPPMAALQQAACAGGWPDTITQIASGPIVPTPGAGTANPASFPHLPRQLAALASACTEEMVGSGRYAEAFAFGLDLGDLLSLGAAPGDFDASASIGTLFTSQLSLRANRRDLAIQPVPFLSQKSINRLAALEVQNLEALAVQVEKARDSTQPISNALQAARGAAAAAAAQAGVYQDALGLDMKYVHSLGLAVQQLNESFLEAHANLNKTGKAFMEGVKEKVEENIFEAAFELVFAILSALIGGIGEGAAIAKIGKDAGSLAALFKDLDKVANLLKEIGTLLSGINSIIAASVALNNAINSNPVGNTDLSGAIASALSGNLSSGNLASLASSALAFQNLHDEAYLTVGPAINQGISGAAAYAEALAKTANAGGDLVKAQVNYLAAQNKELVAALKFQAAQAEATALQARANQLANDETAVVDAVIEMEFSLMKQKLRSLGLIWEACSAYEFAKTLPCPVNSSFSYPSLSSPAKYFAYQLDAALASVTQVADLEQCFCNISWVITEPTFIGNLSANGSAVLDLSDPWGELVRDLRPFDNFHVLRMDLKPFGIQPAGTNPDPILALTVTSNGEYRSLTTDPASGQRLVQSFMAPTFPLGLTLQPTIGWKVVEFADLIDVETGKDYVPTPYTRFLVEDNPLGSRWNWSGVFAVQIELWGYGRNSYGGSVGALGACDVCQTISTGGSSTGQR